MSKRGRREAALKQKLRAEGYAYIAHVDWLREHIDQLARFAGKKYHSPSNVVSTWLRGKGLEYDGVCYIVLEQEGYSLHFISGNIRRVEVEGRYRTETASFNLII